MNLPTIPALDRAAAAAARAHQAELTKPAGALGRLEDIACWLAACQGQAVPLPVTPAIAVFAGDHGVTAQGVSAYPSVVTAEMVRNFARGGAAISVLARLRGAPLTIVDVGVATPLDYASSIRNERVRAGTADSSSEPAMTPAQAEAAIAAGGAIARAQITAGATLLIGGEMGIGNSTAAAALLVALAEVPLEDAVGAGTGLDDAGIAHKRTVVARIVARARRDRPNDALAWLAQVGGLEIAALAGYYIGAALARQPMLVDGFIASVAALLAERLAPGTKAWMLAAHRSAERGHAAALAALGLPPLVDLGMRLGEGSGAAVVIPLLDAAIALHAQMATFAQAAVSTSERA